MNCATDISGKGGISEYISGREGILEVFLILGYCRVVLFDWFFFWKCFTLSTAVRSGSSGVREACGSGQCCGSCYRVEQ